MLVVEPVTLEGHGVRLEPLTEEHSDALSTAVSDGRLWELYFTKVPEPSEMMGYIETALEGFHEGHMLPWAVRELSTGRIVGSTRYHDIIPEVNRVEIGYTWYSRSWQRTHVNTGCKLLLLEHAFGTLGCSVVGLRTDILNTTSQRAIEALGAKRDGVIRCYRTRKDGSISDTVMYSILADEWPDIRLRLEERIGRAR